MDSSPRMVLVLPVPANGNSNEEWAAHTWAGNEEGNAHRAAIPKKEGL